MINVQNRSSNIQIPTVNLEPQISQVPTAKIFTTATDEPREPLPLMNREREREREREDVRSEVQAEAELAAAKESQGPDSDRSKDWRQWSLRQ